MSGAEWRLVFAGDNSLYLLFFERPESLDGIWSTFLSCDVCCKRNKNMTPFFYTLIICCPLTLEFMVKLPCLHKDTCIHVKMTLKLIIFRPTLEWIFYDSIPLYLSWFVTIKPSENSHQLFTFAQQSHQNLSEWSNDETPGNTWEKKLLNIFVFIIKFLKTMWKHKN